MSSKEIITGLAAVQADKPGNMGGWRDCGHVPGAVWPLVARLLTRSQVFACEGRCGGVAGAGPLEVWCRVGGDRR